MSPSPPRGGALGAGHRQGRVFWATFLSSFLPGELRASKCVWARRSVPRESVRSRMAASGEARRVLVYGGRGALGSRCVQAFRARNWVTLRDGRCKRQTLGVAGRSGTAGHVHA